MRVAAAGRAGGMGASRESSGPAGGAAADAATGPPPRLLKSPPKVETLPAHFFSPVEQGKIHKLRCFFDSLEIVDEDPVASIAAETPSKADASITANASEMSDDDTCWHDAIDGNPTSEAATATHLFSRSASQVATSTSDTSGIEPASSAGDAAATGGSTTPPNSPAACAAAKNPPAEGPSPPSKSSWFSWNFLGAGEASAAASASPSSLQAQANTATAASSGSTVSQMPHGVAGKEKQQERQTQLQKQTQQQEQQEQAQREKEEVQQFKLYWDEVLWLEDDLILARYLRSYGWDCEEAREQLLRTLLWRRQERPHQLSPNQVASFARSGCVYRKGFDIYGRAVIYFKPGRDSSTGSHLFQRYVVYTIERAIESLDREGGVDQLVFVVDFSEWGILQLPRTEVSREIVTILNDHYTDVLAAAFIVNAPSYFDPIWRLVSLMVHPDTAKKVIFVNNTKESCSQTQMATGSHTSGEGGSGVGSPGGDFTSSGTTQGEGTPLNVLRQIIPFPFLEECVGGESPLDYDHDVYWKAEKEQYLQQSAHRRQQRLALQNAVRRRRRLQQQQQRQETAAAGTPVSGVSIATPGDGL